MKFYFDPKKNGFQSLIGNVQHSRLDYELRKKEKFQSLIGNVQRLSLWRHQRKKKKSFNPS